MNLCKSIEARKKFDQCDVSKAEKLFLESE